jgi:signal transduction histidine kinase
MSFKEPKSLLAENEAARLEKLRDYRILDTHSEDTFDKLALMASQIFNAQSAFIVFVDEHRVFLKSNLSQLTHNEVPRDSSLSALAILDDNVTVINDTYDIPWLVANEFVALEGGVRFFAGAPLTSPEGHNVGVICVGHPEPGEATELQLDMLKTLAKITVDKLENRLRYRKTIEAQINLMNFALHEIKNPLASIKLANEVLKKDESSKDRMTELIKSSVNIIQNKLSDLLKQSELEETELTLSIEEVDMQEMFRRLLNNFELLAQRKNQVLKLHCEDNLPKLYADKAKISDILHNLVSNAIKYSYYGSTIDINAREVLGYMEIRVKDEGQGLNKDDVIRLFRKFAKLSSKPTGKETSNGLGLSITKSLVELHNGTIQAISPGKDRGTMFIVTLPLKYETEAPELVISH